MSENVYPLGHPIMAIRPFHKVSKLKYYMGEIASYAMLVMGAVSSGGTDDCRRNL